MKELSEELLRLIETVEPQPRDMSLAESAKPIRAGGWSRRQIVGHLIDSASNNHQRFVRAEPQESLEFPGYDQDGCVRVQDVQNADWELLVSLRTTYNRYLAHVISYSPASKLT